MKAKGIRQKAEISVVIPVFNAEVFLRKCLDSVLCQTFSNIEIICINDGSTDNSGTILDEYFARDERIKIITKKNAGVSAARNDGVDASVGDFIHFMDADDFIDSDYYEKMLYALGFMHADVVASGFISNSKYTPGIKYKKNKTIFGIYKIFQRTNALVDSYIWRYLFKREFLIKNKLKFRTDLVSQEDAVFLLDALKSANCVAIAGGANYHYILNPDSALNSRDPAKRAKIKKQYKFGKEYRKQFARDNGLMPLWRRRKIQKWPLIGKFFKG